MTHSETRPLSGVAYLKAIQKTRDSVPLPATFDELWSADDKLLPQYQDHRPAQRVLIRYAERANGKVTQDIRAELPPGVRQALRMGPDLSQLRMRYPWAVMWVRVREGQRVTGQKKFQSLAAAAFFYLEYKPQISNMTIVSRHRSYDIPASLRGRLPKGWYWCPRCMVPRRYQRHPEEREFTAIKKVWLPSKQKYDWVERRLVVLVCPLCGCNNRDPIWRRSNQPWELRRVKRRRRRRK